jgi:hypothetical protein
MSVESSLASQELPVCHRSRRNSCLTDFPTCFTAVARAVCDIFQRGLDFKKQARLHAATVVRARVCARKCALRARADDDSDSTDVDPEQARRNGSDESGRPWGEGKATAGKMARGGGSALVPLLLLAASTSPAAAQCVPTTAPTSGTTVTCPGSSTTPVVAAAGSTGVTINVNPGASVSGSHVIAVPFPVLGVQQNSTITNSGTLNLSGGAGSGTNRGAAMLVNTNSNNLTNVTGATISTTGVFNDGMAANGSGNTLTNNGSITTTGPNAYGMTAAWGQTNTGQVNNSLINTGTVSTSGSSARAASILGGSGLINNSGTLSTTGAGSTGAYLQGNNDQLINSGNINVSGAGSFAVDSNTVSSSFTATIQNLAGGQIVGQNGTAIRTLNGNTTITNAGTIPEEEA